MPTCQLFAYISVASIWNIVEESIMSKTQVCSQRIAGSFGTTDTLIKQISIARQNYTYYGEKLYEIIHNR